MGVNSFNTKKERRGGTDVHPVRGGDPTAASATVTLLRLLAPQSPTLRSDPQDQTSTFDSSAPTTGGVYKIDGRIHRHLVNADY